MFQCHTDKTLKEKLKENSLSVRKRDCWYWWMRLESLLKCCTAVWWTQIVQYDTPLIFTNHIALHHSCIFSSLCFHVFFYLFIYLANTRCHHMSPGIDYGVKNVIPLHTFSTVNCKLIFQLRTFRRLWAH